MRNIRLFSLAALFSVFGFFNLPAQTPAPDVPVPNDCRRQINVYSIDALREDSPPLLTGAKIILKNAAGKIIKPASDGNLYIGLPAGDYEARAALNGYKTSVKSFGVTCDNAYLPVEKIIPENLFLWPGDSKEIVNGAEKFRGVFAVAASPDTPVEKAADSPAVINGKAVYLGSPAYPAAARAVRVSGAVNVQVTIDELGTVISASPVSGHPLLRPTVVKAALESKFRPTTLEGFPVKVTGIIVYNFTAAQ